MFGPHRTTVLSLASSVLVCLVATATNAAIMGFGDFTGFTVNKTDAGPAPVTSPGLIQLTSQPSTQQARSIFFNTPQDISSFSASFRYQALNAISGNAGYGAAFVVQNSAAGAQAIGAAGTGFQLGYGGVDQSAAATLQLNGFFTTHNIYLNGIVAGGTGIANFHDLASGHPIDVTVTYDGTNLRARFVDSVTMAILEREPYLVDLPAQIGGSTAFVGFTASTSTNASADQQISNFTLTSVPEPPSVQIAIFASCVAWGIRPRGRIHA